MRLTLNYLQKFAIHCCAWCNNFLCTIQQRYVLSLMAFLALSNAYAIRTNLAMTITRMVADPDINLNNNINNRTNTSAMCYIDIDDFEMITRFSLVENQTSNNNLFAKNEIRGGQFQWSQEMQGIILSSFYWGYVLAHVPGGLLAQKYGGKYILAFGIFLSGFLSLLIPVCVNYGGAHSLIAIRMLMGMCQGPIIPACMSLFSSWIPLKERCTILSLVNSGITVGIIAGTFISALLLHVMHSWHSVFYFFGTMSIIWFFLFIILCYRTPDAHPFINVCEKSYLEHELCNCVNDNATNIIPWRAIFTCAPVYALIFAYFVHDWGFYIITIDLPKYLNDVLHMSIQNNGIYSTLPHIFELMGSVSIGFLSDWITTKKYLSTTVSRKIFTIAASVFGAIFFMATSFAGCNKILFVLFLTLLVGSQCLKNPGISVNILDLAPNYVSVLAAVVNGIGSFAGILAPYIIGVMTPNALLSEWRSVFWLTFGMYLMGMIVFVLYGSGEIQSWNVLPQDLEDIAADLRTTKTVENFVKISAFLLINAIVLLLVTYI